MRVPSLTTRVVGGAPKIAHRLSLTQRLSLVFALLLLACCGASAWLQIRSNALHEQEVIQSLSRGLASHIAQSHTLMDTEGPRTDALRQLFGQLMVVNPSVEVYLLDRDGTIRADDAPAGHLRSARVDLAPIHRFLAGDPLPIFGDDPRQPGAQKVFSAAPVTAGDKPEGYIYVVLQGELRDRLDAEVGASAVLRTTLRLMALVATLGLIAGLTAFSLINRPLRRLTEAMQHFDADGDPERQPTVPRTEATTRHPRDEIAILETAFAQMASRIAEQWQTLNRQDHERRELVANLSHDLRTPLTSLHGYLETLSFKFDALSDADRRRYTGIALAQSAKVGRLAQALFELATLEHGLVALDRETFSIDDLLQDVLQKFELQLEARHISVVADRPDRLAAVDADVGMIERVLTNLLDNAIRHTPERGVVTVTLANEHRAVCVTIGDTGPGIAPAQRERLFVRPFNVGRTPHGGGLGLLLVHRMLALHGCSIALVDTERPGATFAFRLPTAASSPIITPSEPS